MFFPITVKEDINDAIAWLVGNFGDALREFSSVILHNILVPLENILRSAPPWMILLAVAGVAWHATRRWSKALAIVALLYLIGCLGLWDAFMQTLTLMLVATVMAIGIGVPLGILTSQHPFLRRMVFPVLDVMQTLPSFVYLIPFLMLFGLGKVPALFATVVYAAPPLIRLTELGIRQVDKDVLEAAWSFGTTPWQLLIAVQLPLALPSIMAGVNQTTMMALSMVVIASMIGARGLGEDVLAGIQTLDVGRGLQAGVAVVILAVVIDRITQAYGQNRRERARASLRRSGKFAKPVNDTVA